MKWESMYVHAHAYGMVWAGLGWSLEATVWAPQPCLADDAETQLSCAAPSPLPRHDVAWHVLFDGYLFSLLLFLYQSFHHSIILLPIYYYTLSPSSLFVYILPSLDLDIASPIHALPTRQSTQPSPSSPTQVLASYRIRNSLSKCCKLAQSHGLMLVFVIPVIFCSISNIPFRVMISRSQFVELSPRWFWVRS